MNACNKHLARAGSIGLAVLLMFSWGVITLAHAYSRSLGDMNDSFKQGLSAIYALDEITGTVDRIGVDQRAFLSTGQHRFEESLWIATEGMDRPMEMLRSITSRDAEQQARTMRLFAAVRHLLDCVARSYEIRDARGRRAAMVYFDGCEDAVADANAQAGELKSVIIANVSGRILNARASSALIQAMLHAQPSGTGMGPASNSRLQAISGAGRPPHCILICASQRAGCIGHQLSRLLKKSSQPACPSQ
jgi:CHASE3 domain sensor protein